MAYLGDRNLPWAPRCSRIFIGYQNLFIYKKASASRGFSPPDFPDPTGGFPHKGESRRMGGPGSPLSPLTKGCVLSWLREAVCLGHLNFWPLLCMKMYKTHKRFSASPLTLHQRLRPRPQGADHGKKLGACHGLPLDKSCIRPLFRSPDLLMTPGVPLPVLNRQLIRTHIPHPCLLLCDHGNDSQVTSCRQTPLGYISEMQ